MQHQSMWHLPQTPYDVLGPLGRLTKYLMENYKTAVQLGYLVTVLSHLGEAMFTIKLCKMKGITDTSTQLRWFVQTLVAGLLSFGLLLAYKPPIRSE